jgi:hypothetical protein
MSNNDGLSDLIKKILNIISEGPEPIHAPDAAGLPASGPADGLATEDDVDKTIKNIIGIIEKITDVKPKKNSMFSKLTGSISGLFKKSPGSSVSPGSPGSILSSASSSLSSLSVSARNALDRFKNVEVFTPESIPEDRSCPTEEVDAKTGKRIYRVAHNKINCITDKAEIKEPIEEEEEEP